MKRFVFISLSFLLFNASRCNISECVSSECLLVESIKSTDRGRSITIKWENEGLKQLILRTIEPDTAIILNPKDTVLTFSPENIPRYVRLEYNCSSECAMDGSRYIIGPYELYTYSLCLYDTCNNTLGITYPPISIKETSSYDSSKDTFYIKFIKLSGEIYAVGLYSRIGKVLISDSISEILAPDTSNYSDTVKLIGTHALWLNSASSNIDTNDYFGKITILSASNDSITVSIGFRTDVKGLRWIK